MRLRPARPLSTGMREQENSVVWETTDGRSVTCIPDHLQQKGTKIARGYALRSTGLSSTQLSRRLQALQAAAVLRARESKRPHLFRIQGTPGALPGCATTLLSVCQGSEQVGGRTAPLLFLLMHRVCSPPVKRCELGASPRGGATLESQSGKVPRPS